MNNYDKITMIAHTALIDYRNKNEVDIKDGDLMAVVFEKKIAIMIFDGDAIDMKILEFKHIMNWKDGISDKL